MLKLPRSTHPDDQIAKILQFFSSLLEPGTGGQRRAAQGARAARRLSQPGHHRIVLLTRDIPLARPVAHALQRRFDDIAIITIAKISGSALLKHSIHRIRRIGVRRALGRFPLLAYGVLANRLAERRRRAIFAQHQLDSSPLPEGKVYRVPSVNADEAIRLLHELAPDVVVVFFTPIISARVLKAIHVPFINMHGGITPSYRGNHCTYWSLVSDDHENCGVTVHLIDEGIDTGDIVYQIKTQPTPDDNFFTYQLFQTAAGIPLLLQAVEDALNGSLRTYRRDDQRSACWPTPTLFEYLRNGWRTGVW